MSRMSDTFEHFHDENPRVYSELVRLARLWVARTGSHRLGIGMLYERARWELSIQTTDPEYKLSNNHRSFYARLIMFQEPDLAGLFVLRPSDADEWIQELAEND